MSFWRIVVMRKSQIALAVAAAFGAGAAATTANAVDLVATLTGVTSHGANSSSLKIAGTTATWSYNTSSGIVTGSGLYQSRGQISPVSIVFDHDITNLVIGGGGAANATTYICTEGNFGTGVGASICGNYNFGANYVNESSTSWGPGTAAARTLAGDDVSSGPQQALSAFDGMTSTLAGNGTDLAVSNEVTGVSGTTFDFTVAAIPIPAVAYLFPAGLIAGLGWMRRKAKSV
jgi:hypothetical protein